MLKRPGTRSNRLGPDPDPTDHLKYRPEPVWVPGPRVLREDLYNEVHLPPVSQTRLKPSPGLKCNSELFQLVETCTD